MGVIYNGEDCQISDDSKSPGENVNNKDLAKSSDVEAQFSVKERRRILKNVLAISSAFLCLFTAFQGMSNLQSSINSEANLGTNSLTTIYVSLIVSCLLFPSLILKHLTCKWTMVVCSWCYTLYIAAQFYPRYFTMIPTAIVLGLGAAPLWSAKCTYLTQVGTVQAEIEQTSSEPIVVRFFGIFFLFFQSTQVLGNLISSLVLSPDEAASNVTLTEDELMKCGYNFCPVTNQTTSNNTNNQQPTPDKIYTLAGVYLVLALCASVVIAVLVDNLSRYGERGRANNSQQVSPMKLVVATATHLKKPYQLLIIPLTLWSGFEQAFIAADFTKAYVTCSWGVHRVGLVMIVFGVCDALGSISFGFIIKKIGRLPIFIAGAVLNYAVIAIFLHWQPSPDEAYMYFLIAALWGLADSVWQTQINAFYGVIFPGTSEAAFSNYRLWESCGFAISFFTQGYTCVAGKVYFLAVILTLGMLGYIGIEVCEHRKSRAKLSVTHM